MSPRAAARASSEPSRAIRARAARAGLRAAGTARRTRGLPSRRAFRSRASTGGPLPGPGTGTGGPRRGWRRWVRPKRILLIVAALVVLLIVASVGLYFDLNSKLTRIPALVPTSLTSDGHELADRGLGQPWWPDHGAGERAGPRARHHRRPVGHDPDPACAVDRGRQAGGARDSYVAIPGYGYNKINAAYSLGGPKLLIETVQNVTKLHINHYMGIGFGGLVDVVD